MNKKIKVLIIDDSALVRQTLTLLLSADPSIEVIGAAADPYIAVEKIKNELPDVITLDIEMPRMDGLTFLKKLMAQHPIPVVVISTLGERNTETAIMALEYGAIEVVAKPKVNTKQLLLNSQIELCDKIKAASMALVKQKNHSASPSTPTVAKKLSSDIPIKKNTSRSLVKTTELVIAVGASTGGTNALKEFLVSLPTDSPGIVIVQHMPEMFTTQFAKRLDGLCEISVKEAQDKDPILRGQALIAPGGKHLLVKRSGAFYHVEISDAPFVNRHKPSVDVLFGSVAQYAGKNAIGIIMTGMGGDGAKGLLEMKEAGAYTIAQDEASCVVFGMPKEAIKLNAANIVLPLSQISSHVLKHTK